MTGADPTAFVEACTNLIGRVATNPSLADAIVAALEAGDLSPTTGPMGISRVLKGAPGSHDLGAFLKAWKSCASHLEAADVTATVRSALACYRLAQGRAHAVDAVWTGPEVPGSEVRRTEAVVGEIVTSAQEELLVVGYWLVASTAQVKGLIELLVQRARSGVQVRFVFDPSDKRRGPDNFAALTERWPADLAQAPRQVFSWSERLANVTRTNGGQHERKLHAKVIVADRADALVTSANLTHAGLIENLEMGLRIQGPTAGAVVGHFDRLITEGILEPQ